MGEEEGEEEEWKQEEEEKEDALSVTETSEVASS